MAKDDNYNRIIHGKEWRRVSKLYKAAHPLCEECEKWPATAVHHRRPLETFTNFGDMLAAAYDWQNLESVCQKCHDKLHKELDSHNFARNKELAARRNEDRASSILSLFED
jgi:hypothetical protein